MSQGPYNIDYALYSQFERLGHPGRYITTLKYTSGQLEQTGSKYGYGALMVVTAGGTYGTYLDMEGSLSKISGGTGSVIYVFKRQGM